VGGHAAVGVAALLLDLVGATVGVFLDLVGLTVQGVFLGVGRGGDADRGMTTHNTPTTN
jgi:hypothetical protein